MSLSFPRGLFGFFLALLGVYPLPTGVSTISYAHCRSDEISSRLATAMAELQRAKDAAAEKEGALLLLQDKVEELGKKVNPSTKELAEAQADVRAKRKEVEEAKLRVAEASRRFADLQKQAEMEHRKADAALREAEQKEAGTFCLFHLCWQSLCRQSL